MEKIQENKKGVIIRVYHMSHLWAVMILAQDTDLTKYCNYKCVGDMREEEMGTFERDN